MSEKKELIRRQKTFAHVRDVTTWIDNLKQAGFEFTNIQIKKVKHRDEPDWVFWQVRVSFK